MGLGGNPFGPAGTGKTESVKMLASLLGRFCLVFNCDESFDFQAMGRIFPRTVPGGRVGLLRRVQPAGGAHPVGGIAADLDHPDGPAPPAEGDPPAGHARGAAPERGHLRDDEPGLRGPLEPAGQPEATVPQHRDDPAGLGAHRASDALLAGLPLVGDAGGQAGAALLAVPRPAVGAAGTTTSGFAR